MIPGSGRRYPRCCRLHLVAVPSPLQPHPERLGPQVRDQAGNGVLQLPGGSGSRQLILFLNRSRGKMVKKGMRVEGVRRCPTRPLHSRIHPGRKNAGLKVGWGTLGCTTRVNTTSCPNEMAMPTPSTVGSSASRRGNVSGRSIPTHQPGWFVASINILPNLIR